MEFENEAMTDAHITCGSRCRPLVSENPEGAKEQAMKHTTHAHITRAITAGLVGAMLTPSMLAPASAIAQEAGSHASQRAAVRQSIAPTPASRALATLVTAANGQAIMTLEQARALLAQIEAEAAAAQQAAVQQAKAAQDARQALQAAASQARESAEQAAAELQAQIGGLKQQLTNAQAEADALAQQKTDAEAALVELDSRLTAAKDDARSKQTALDEAQQKLDAAQQALDALGDNPTADEQAAYDAAKQKVDAAEAAHAAAQDALDAATTTLSQLTGELAQAQEELAAAQDQLTAKQTAAGQAQQALDNAQATYDQALKDADVQSIEEAERNLATTQAAVDNANKDVADTQARIQALSGQIEQIDAQIVNEQAKVTAAQDTAATAETNVISAQAKLDQAASALDDLKGAQEAWDKQAAQLKQDVESAQADVATKQAELDQANQAVDDLAKQTSDLQRQIDGLKAQIGEAARLSVEDFGDFLIWCMQTGNQSGRYGLNNAIMTLYGTVWNDLEPGPDGRPMRPGSPQQNGNIQMDDKWGGELHVGNVISDFTDLTDAADASSIDNILKALDIIEAANKIRTEAGLDGLMITQDMMVISILQTNWSSWNLESNHVLDHAANIISKYNPNMSNGMNVAENLAAGFTPEGAVNAWYKEREVFQQLCREHLGHEVSDAEAWETFSNTPELQAHFAEIGHYINILDPSYTVTGAAVSGQVSGQVYNYSNAFKDRVQYWSEGYNDGNRYTVAEYRALIERAVAEGVNDPFGPVPEDSPAAESIKKEIAKLKEQLDGANENLSAAQQTAQDFTAGLAGATQELKQKQQALKDLGERPTNESLQGAYDQALKELDAAKQAHKQADANLKDVRASAEKAIGDLKAEKKGEQDALSNAQGALDDLKQAAKDAQAKLDETKAHYADLMKVHADLEQAASDADDALKTLAAAQAAVNGLTEQIAQCERDVDAAKTAVATKQAELAALPGASKEQLKALEDARTSLDAAKAKLAELTAARDEARTARDKAVAAKELADARVAEVQNDIKLNERLLAEAEAGLPAAQQNAAHWQDVFAQQDAHDIVVDGFNGSVQDPGISQALARAHDTYVAKLEAANAAKAHVAAAQAALDEALSKQETTDTELAEKLADLAMAQDAYRRIAAELNSADSSSQQPGGVATQAVYEAGTFDDLPQTGDATALAVTGLALAGAVALVSGKHFRRKGE